MAKKPYFSKQNWWLGRIIGEVEFNTHQDAIEAALAYKSLEVEGYGLIGSAGSQAVASSPPDLYNNLAAASFMVPDGKLIGWDASQQVDMSIADQGTVQGPTAAQNAGNKRYVVMAGIHEFLEEDPDTDDDGGPVYSTRRSSSTFGVWMSQDVALADVWYTSTALKNLIVNIIAAGQVPITLGIREYGATVLDQDHLFEIYRTSQAHELAHEQANRLLAELVATSDLPLVLNALGEVAIVGAAVASQPGTVTLAGGENIAFCSNGAKGSQALYDTDNFKKRLIVRSIPLNEVLTLTAPNTEYVVRARLDPETNKIVVYFGEGFYPGDEADGWNPGNDGFGVQGGTNLGFLNTWIDIALAKVETGALGSVPTVTKIRGDHASRLNYLNSIAPLVPTAVQAADLLAQTSEFEYKQPYFCGDSSGSYVQPLTAGAGLTLNYASMRFGGSRLHPLALSSGSLSLVDNTINLIYADLSVVPGVITSADLAGGGGPTRTNDYVMLGFVRTAGAAIVEVVNSPMTFSDVRIPDVECEEVRNESVLEIGPTVAKMLIAGPFTMPGVYKAPWTTQLDPTLSANWDGGGIGGISLFHYLYADPGGTDRVSERPYCMFKLSTTKPNASTGRHPTKPNLVFICAVYKTGAGTIQRFNKKGDLTLTPEVQCLATGQATSRTAVPLLSYVPETATHVRLNVLVNPLATVGAGAVECSLYEAATGTKYAGVNASGESGSNTSESYTGGIVELPIDKSIAGGRFYYAINDASASVDIFVLGWREGKRQRDANNVVSY